MQKIVLLDDDVQKIKELYKQKISISKISCMFNVSCRVIRRVLKENEIVIRDCHDYRKYACNQHYFDSIDSPNKAYIMGLLLSDGNNNIDTHKFTITLQDRDKQVLEDIKSELNIDCPLLYRNLKDKNPNWHDSYTLVVNSKYMSDRLNELGMIPNKSLILDFPRWITEELFPFMLKGYIDGDGWIQKYNIGFMSSDKFCYGVQQYLMEHYHIEARIMDMKRHYDKRIKTCYIQNKKNYLPLVKLMFSQPTIGIARKVAKYQEFGFIDTNKTYQCNELIS